jgi:hypothetical protein
MKYLETVPQPLLEQWLLGVLPPAQVTRVEENLRAAGLEPTLVRAELEADNAAILEALPFAKVEARLEGARGNQQRWRPGLPALGLALGAAAAVILLLGLPAGDPGAKKPASGLAGVEDGTRLKGGSRLLLYRVDGQSSELLTNGSQVAAGEAIQVLFQLEEPGCVAILSVDAKGAVSRHFPTDNRGCTEVSDLGPQSAPRGFVLDATPGFERFFLVRADRALPWSTLEGRVKAAGAEGQPQAGQGLEIRSALLVKKTGGAR